MLMADCFPGYPDVRLRLTWLQEDAPSSLRASIGAPLDSSTLLPALYQLTEGVPPGIVYDLAERVLKSAEGGTEVEVHLPYIDRRDWKRRSVVLASTTFRKHAGRLLPAAYVVNQKEFNHYIARLVAAAAFHSWDEPGCHRATLASLKDDIEPLPVEACAAWRSAPDEKSVQYFPAHAPVSVAIQELLRRALYEERLADLSACSRVDQTCALLAYSSSAPFPGRRRTEFTYDVLKPTWFITAFHFARKPLAQKLKEVERALTRAGQLGVAELYAQLDAKNLIKRFRRHKRPVERILSAEERVINLVLAFGISARHAASARQLELISTGFADRLETRLQRLTGNRARQLVPSVIIAATRALDEALRKQQSNPVVLGVTDVDQPPPVNEDTVGTGELALDGFPVDPVTA
jgi:hypothetical protein